MSDETLTANIARVARLAYTIDAYEAGEGAIDRVADRLRELAAALREDVNGELGRLRAEVERLTVLERAQLASARELHEELERLTRERDDGFAARADKIGELQGLLTAAAERAETAERERDDARREVCLRRVRDHGPRFGDDKAFERDARALAKRLGWECFADDCPECWGENGQHAMSCSRGENRTTAICSHPKCVDGMIETWQGACEPVRTPCPRCSHRGVEG